MLQQGNQFTYIERCQFAYIEIYVSKHIPA